MAEDLSKKLREKADECSSDGELFDLLISAAEFIEHVEWKLDRIDDRIDDINEALARTIERVVQSDNP